MVDGLTMCAVVVEMLAFVAMLFGVCHAWRMIILIDSMEEVMKHVFPSVILDLSARTDSRQRRPSTSKRLRVIAVALCTGARVALKCRSHKSSMQGSTLCLPTLRTNCLLIR